MSILYRPNSTQVERKSQISGLDLTLNAARRAEQQRQATDGATTLMSKHKKCFRANTMKLIPKIDIHSWRVFNLFDLYNKNAVLKQLNVIN